MSTRRIVLVLLLCLAAFPLVSHAATREPLLGIVDLANHRVLLPEGSVLPFNMEFRAERLRGPHRGIADRQKGVQIESLRTSLTLPLKVEYAPAERFVQVRQRYDQQEAKKAEARRNGRHLMPATNTADHCFPTYFEDSETGYYGTYYNGFTSTFCQQSSGIQNYAFLDWSFTASGAYTDDDEWVYPYAYVWDNNNNFRCQYNAYGYVSPVECTASNHTQLLQVGCLNSVTTAAQLYTIEYLNNYEPYYLGYSFSLTYCTYFY